jgi:hypothetical protein
MIDSLSMGSGPSGAGNLAPGFQGAGAHHFHHIVFVADRTLDIFSGTQDQLFKLKTAILAKIFKNRHNEILGLNYGSGSETWEHVEKLTYLIFIIPPAAKNKEFKRRFFRHGFKAPRVEAS